MASIESGRTYSLVNAKSGTCMASREEDNASIVGDDYEPGDDLMHWEAAQADSAWTLRNVATGRYLAISSGRVADGTLVTLADSPVEWEIYSDEKDSSIYRVYARGQFSELNLDLEGYGNPAPGTPVRLWSKSDGTHQCWQFEEAEEF
ncbi:RICIN domain-containing protein [Streptomyces sp. NPDC037389]|uniref:RICIN domain-containing protein n=1 Tax=Streptomyces sp. NPDC037389 TaxID=3155369 RepID=UPI0033C7588C